MAAYGTSTNKKRCAMTQYIPIAILRLACTVTPQILFLFYTLKSYLDLNIHVWFIQYVSVYHQFQSTAGQTSFSYYAFVKLYHCFSLGKSCVFNILSTPAADALDFYWDTLNLPEATKIQKHYKNLKEENFTLKNAWTPICTNTRILKFNRE